MLDSYDSETLERVQQSLFKRYNHALQAFGGNDFGMKHTGIAKKQRNETSAKWVAIDRDAYRAVLDRWIDGDDEIVESGIRRKKQGRIEHSNPVFL